MVLQRVPSRFLLQRTQGGEFVSRNPVCNDRLYPAILEPRLGPLNRALNHILGIGSDDKGVEPLTSPVSETQGGDDGAELGPVAGLQAVVAKRSLLL